MINTEKFLKEFNISFGYPCVDTCLIYDEYNSKIRCLETEKKTCGSSDPQNQINLYMKQLKTHNIVYKMKGKASYIRRKKSTTKESKNIMHKKAICFDYGLSLKFLMCRQTTYIIRDSCLCMSLMLQSYHHLKVYFTYIQKQPGKKK